MFKFQRKVNYLKTQDGLLHFNLCDETSGSFGKVREGIEQLNKKLATHPGEYRVPFIARVKALEGSEALYVGLGESNGL